MTTFAKSLKVERRRITYPKKMYELIKSQSAKDFRGIEDEVLVLIAQGLHHNADHKDKCDIHKFL